MYLDENDLYGLAMSQKLSVDGFKWKKIHLNVLKKLQEIMMRTVIRDISLK